MRARSFSMRLRRRSSWQWAIAAIAIVVTGWTPALSTCLACDAGPGIECCTQTTPPACCPSSTNDATPVQSDCDCNLEQDLDEFPLVSVSRPAEFYAASQHAYTLVAEPAQNEYHDGFAQEHAPPAFCRPDETCRFRL